MKEDKNLFSVTEMEAARVKQIRHEPFATVLRQLRESRGLTMRDVTADGIIGYATYRQWEAGEYLPNTGSLPLLLKALAATSEEAEQLQSLINAPRVLRVQPKPQPLGTANNRYAPAYMPSVGDLWKALRQRAGLTTAQVAQSLGVDTPRVSKWEHAQCAVPEHRVEALLTLCHATETETAELRRRRSWLTCPFVDQSLTLESLDDFAQRQVWMVHRGCEAPLDLAFLALEAQLWPFAQRNAEAQRILAFIWTHHADHLVWQGRFKEMHEYVRSVMKFARTTLAQDDKFHKLNTFWFLAASMEASYETLTGTPKGYKRGIGVLDEWNTLAVKAEVRTHFLRDMASYHAELGQTSEALALLKASRKIAEEQADSVSIGLADYVSGRTLVKAGQPEAALPLLNGAMDVFPKSSFDQLYYFAKANLQTGQKADAERCLVRMSDILNEGRHEHKRRQAEEIAHQL